MFIIVLIYIFECINVVKCVLCVSIMKNFIFSIRIMCGVRILINRLFSTGELIL